MLLFYCLQNKNTQLRHKRFLNMQNTIIAGNDSTLSSYIIRKSFFFYLANTDIKKNIKEVDIYILLNYIKPCNNWFLFTSAIIYSVT